MKKLGGEVRVIAVGRIRKSHWEAAQDDYVGRIGRYTKFRLVEVKDAVGKGMDDATAIQKEGEKLLKASHFASRRIALTPIGIQMTSPELGDYLQRQIQIYGKLAFLIGGPLGFSEEVLTQCEEQISLSSFTFPHELARVIWLEQLYRACTILGNEPYHK